MTFATSYSYGDRSIFDLKTLFNAIRFILVNSILAFIFLFLVIEEIEWALFTYKERLIDKIEDNTSWNIKKLI
tara:strand:+ start:189 stop:407 length:219 start_codon:yes stop_codon:yes gene_type:complete